MIQLAARWRDTMRTVAEYIAKAVEFDGLARAASEPTLKKRYADLAKSYRLLAQERERLVACGALPSDAVMPRNQVIVRAQ
jgi:hypothetical protein